MSLRFRISVLPSIPLKDGGAMHQAYVEVVKEYQAHPHTQLLTRFSTLELAAAADEEKLADMTPLQIKFLLDYALALKPSKPRIPLLSSALQRLQGRELLSQVCKALFAWEKDLDPALLPGMAATLVLSAPTESLMWDVGVEAQRYVLDVATRSGDMAVLNAIGSRATLGLKLFPTIIGRLGEHVGELAPDARRGFLVGCRDDSWPQKEAFLLEYVDW